MKKGTSPRAPYRQKLLTYDILRPTYAVTVTQNMPSSASVGACFVFTLPLLYRGISTPQSYSSKMPAPLTQGGHCFCANAMRYCRSPCLPCARGGAERSEAEGLQAKAGCVCDPGRRRRKGCRSPSPRKKAAAQRRCRAAQPLRYRGISTPQSFSAKMPAPVWNLLIRAQGSLLLFVNFFLLGIRRFT